MLYSETDCATRISPPPSRYQRRRSRLAKCEFSALIADTLPLPSYVIPSISAPIFQHRVAANSRLAAALKS